MVGAASPPDQPIAPGDPGASTEVSTVRVGRPVFRSGGATDVGGVRDVNEDSWFAGGDVCIVADGMGGHAAGEVASGLVVDLVEEAFAAGPVDLVDLPTFVSSLNTAVLRRGAENDTPGMGTTLVGVAVAGNGESPSAVVFHVGDSRCYRLCAGVLTQLTRDHSHVQELVAAGRITAHEALTHPLRNIITRALGAEVTVEADFHVLVEEDCRLLLCSDGLSGEVDDDLIWDVMTRHRDPGDAARRLVEVTLEGPARDNVTVVVVDVVFPQQPGEDAPTHPHRALPVDDLTDEGATSERTGDVDVTAEPLATPPSAWAPPAGTPIRATSQSRPPAPTDGPRWSGAAAPTPNTGPPDEPIAAPPGGTS